MRTRGREEIEDMWRAIQELELAWEKWFISDECDCEGKCTNCIFFGVCKVRMELDSQIAKGNKFMTYRDEEWEWLIERLNNAIEELATSMTLQERRQILFNVQKREKKYDEWVEWYFSNECGECVTCPYQDVCELPNYDKQDREVDE